MNDQEVNCEGQSYTVQAGDTLYQIAQKYNLSVEDLIVVNPQIEDPDQIFVGQVICIPIEVDKFKKKAVVLMPTQNVEYAGISLRTGGTILFQQINDSEYDVTVFAVGLPNPDSLEAALDFDSYAVMLRSFDRERGATYYSTLNKTVPTGQNPIWSLSLGQIDLENTKVLGIVPYDSQGFVPGSFILVRGN